MNYLVWILTNGRLCAQLWAEQSYAVHKGDEDQRVAKRYEIDEEHRDWPLGVLIGVYPAPVEVVT